MMRPERRSTSASTISSEAMRQATATPPHRVSIMSDAIQEGATQVEFVRLAIKLDVVHWPFDSGIVLRILQDNGYTSFEQRPEFVKATRAGGEFVMERLRQVITFNGFPLSAVVGAKKNFEESLETNTGVVLGDHVAYYENEYILVYLAKKSINDVLANVYSGSGHMESIRGIVKKMYGHPALMCQATAVITTKHGAG